MATAPTICTKKEQLVIIRFLHAEGVSSVDIYRRMLAQYGENCFNKQNINK